MSEDEIDESRSGEGVTHQARPDARQGADASGDRTLTLDDSQASVANGGTLLLEIVGGPDRGRKYTIGAGRGRIRIGRHEDNEIALTDPAASRHHAEIERCENGAVVRDLSSKNGILLDGFRVQEAHLASECCLQIGTSLIKVERGEPTGLPPAAEGDKFDEMLGRSEPIRQVFRIIRKVADSQLTVLTTGETGTGKELVARALHYGSHRAAGPFVVVDCGSVPPDLMENELFGHECGAFTGATSVKRGLFELAEGGTIFLDEVGELSHGQQPKLLRVIEQGEVRRLGNPTPLPVDVRIVAATNRDLHEDVKAGRFREDLYYRLSVLQIHVPPLRERVEDIAMLANYFLVRLNSVSSQKVLARATLDVLRKYQWPGNIRELRHAIERAFLLSAGEVIHPSDVVPFLERHAKRPYRGGGTLAEVEKSAIEDALIACEGNKRAAARKLGVASSTLYQKLRRHRLK